MSSTNLSIQNWNQLQRVYSLTNHPNLLKHDATSRQQMAKKEWNRIKSLSKSEQISEFTKTIHLYQTDENICTSNQRKRKHKALQSNNNITNTPPLKRRRFGSKPTPTPRINQLNSELATTRDELEEVLLTLCIVNQSKKQISEATKRKDELLEDIQKIKKQIQYRESNNKSCQKTRENQKHVKCYVLNHKEEIIQSNEYELQDVHMYAKKGKPRTELLSKGKGLTECIQAVADEHSSTDPKRRSEMAYLNITARGMAKEVNRRMEQKNGIPLKAAHSTIYNRTSMQKK
eukprot:307016_1